MQFRGELADVAADLGKQLQRAYGTSYLVIVSGRSILLTRYDGLAVNAALVVLPDGVHAKTQGTATVTAELVFNAANWDQAQNVYVAAVDDEFVDGGDATVFPAFEERVNGVRGPLIIDGAPRLDEEAFLNNPLMLPGETNLPLPTGTVGTTGADSLTDINATHVGNGVRPGFDPRMNDFPYALALLSGSGTPTAARHPPAPRTRSSPSAAAAPFNVGLTYDGGAVPAGWIEFYGTPDQTQLAHARVDEGVDPARRRRQRRRDLDAAPRRQHDRLHRPARRRGAVARRHPPRRSACAATPSPAARRRPGAQRTSQSRSGSACWATAR